MKRLFPTLSLANMDVITPNSLQNRKSIPSEIRPLSVDASGRSPTQESRRTLLRRKDSITTRPSQVSKYSAAIEAFNVSKEEDKDPLEDARVKLKKFLTHSPAGAWYEDIMLSISIVSTIEFIYQTYLFNDIESEKERLFYLQLIELGFAGCFACDWLLNYFLADHKIKYFFRCSYII